MRKSKLSVLLSLFFFQALLAQFSFDSILNQSPFLKKISMQKDNYHLQIIYTQIDYTNGQPEFKDYYFNTGNENYFYCASLVKLPLSILAYKKLNEIGVPAKSILFTDSSRLCHRTVKRDTSAAKGYPSIEHYVKKMFLISDNEAFSRTYEFLGVDYIHQNLKNWGYPEIRIINRYDGNCAGADHLISNPLRFFDDKLNLLYSQAEQIGSLKFDTAIPNALVGKAYYNTKNKKVNGPKDFSSMNYLPLSNCHKILRDLIYEPASNSGLKEDQQAFLIQYLSALPRQSMYPKYDTKVFYDSYKKYFIYGDSKKSIGDSSVIITNIVGQSYGFMSDCARIKDGKSGVEFMLSAVIYANEDEIINDGKYDYKTIALPFLAELGRQFYNYELRRNLPKQKQ